MIFFINSERVMSNAEELSYDDILRMSGYSPCRNYKIIDEKSNKEYFNNDYIMIKNNMSLMIQEIN